MPRGLLSSFFLMYFIIDPTNRSSIPTVGPDSLTNWMNTQCWQLGIGEILVPCCPQATDSLVRQTDWCVRGPLCLLANKQPPFGVPKSITDSFLLRHAGIWTGESHQKWCQQKLFVSSSPSRLTGTVTSSTGWKRLTRRLDLPSDLEPPKQELHYHAPGIGKKESYCSVRWLIRSIV